MSDKCTETLNQLPKMDRSELQKFWEELFGMPPNPKLRRDLMIPILGYRVQERAYGGLKASTRKYLQKIADQIESNRPVSLPARIKSGTKLLREWGGEVHEVLVTARGFEYRGVEYKTLSEIAMHITGSKWSGPLFFGLRKRSKEKAE